MAREVYKLDPNFRLGRSEYARTVYDAHIRRADEPTPELLKAAAAVLQLTASDPQDYAATSPFVVTILRVSKLLSAKGRDLRALEWLDKLDHLQLQAKPLTRRDHTGQQKESASNREQYYSIRTRALQRLERWQECLDTTLRAIDVCGQLHHDNDLWFARRVALSRLWLGHPEEALTDLQKISGRKPSGFIQTDIAVAAHATGRIDLAFAHALQALLTRDDIGFKLEAARLLAELLWGRGDVEHARAHLRLCIAVRASKGWTPSERLATLAKDWDVVSGQDDPEALLKELRRLWNAWKDGLTPRRAGMILQMLPHGRAGFIRGDDNARFYFRARDWKDNRSSPAPGNRVTFTTRPGFDPKRNQSTIEACDIRSGLPSN